MFSVLFYCVMGFVGVLLASLLAGMLGWPLTLLALGAVGFVGWKEGQRKATAG